MDAALQKIEAGLGHDNSLREDLIRRIEKDLNSSFLSAEDSLIIIYQKLEKLLEQNPAEWNTWLYRVDVREKSIQALQTHSFELSEIALLILEREMQKVIFRKQYNS
ncbi:MAG: hypothetical protein ACPF9D_00470 [Owenweeksia sp.]